MPTLVRPMSYLHSPTWPCHVPTPQAHAPLMLIGLGCGDGGCFSGGLTGRAVRTGSTLSKTRDLAEFLPPQWGRCAHGDPLWLNADFQALAAEKNQLEWGETLALSCSETSRRGSELNQQLLPPSWATNRRK